MNNHLTYRHEHNIHFGKKKHLHDLLFVKFDKLDNRITVVHDKINTHKKSLTTMQVNLN